MKRRSMLKAFAVGSTTCAPLLSLLARSAMAVEKESKLKTIFLFHPNGAVPEIFFPKPGSKNLPAMTAPLQQHADDLLFLDGIGYAGRQNTHEGGTLKCLTGTGGPDIGPLNSIEVQLGKEDWQNREETGITMPSLQMGVGTQWGDGANKRVSFDNGRGLHSVDDPRIIYSQLFAGNAAGSGNGSNQQKIFSTILADLKRLQKNLGEVERERLELHADAMSVLDAKLNPQIPEMSESNNQCSQGPDVSPIGNVSQPALWATSRLETVSDLQQELAVAALSCNFTRTMAFSYGVSVSPIVVPGTGTNDHDLSHQSPARHTTSKIWWMGEIAKLITKLKNTPDGDGSLFDNTIIVTVSDLGHGNKHNHYRIPMFLAGGKNAGLVTGRSLDFRPYGTPKVQGDQNKNDPSINHSDVLMTIAEKAGYKTAKLSTAVGRIENAWAGMDSP